MGRKSSYPRASVAGYPTDNTTVPNDSLAKVNGIGQKVGPSINATQPCPAPAQGLG
jgi:hypothetical protein